MNRYHSNPKGTSRTGMLSSMGKTVSSSSRLYMLWKGTVSSARYTFSQKMQLSDMALQFLKNFTCANYR